MLFVEGALPGEIVDVKVSKDKKRYAFGYPVKRHRNSTERVAPFCRHFSDCGGCTWQYLSYEDQVGYKHRFVREIFQRIGKLNQVPIESPLACSQDRFYRNKMEFAFTRHRWKEEGSAESRGLGLHVRGRFDKILDIRQCYLQPNPSNDIRNGFKRVAVSKNMEFFDSRKRRGLLRSLVIRTSLHRECMVVVVLARRDPAAERAITSLMRSEFPNVTSLFAAYTGTGRGAVDWEDLILLSGSPVIRERCGTLNLQIHPKSFYQTNPLQAERLYSMVREWAHLTGTETVFDLYCGIGSISLYLAKDAGHVYGVESLPEAVRNATENARANGIENCSFRSGRAEQVVTEDFLQRYGRADLVIVDPPRGGLAPAVVRALKGAAPKRIIYVSCNPPTQARDVAALSETHALVRLRPVDMFPHTHHIECVAELAGR